MWVADKRQNDYPVVLRMDVWDGTGVASLFGEKPTSTEHSS